MSASLQAVTLLLAWPALTTQTAPVKPPPAALQAAVQKPAVTVSVEPNPATANQVLEFRATVTPAVNIAWQYEFYLDRMRLTQCVSNSSVCQWTPVTPGKHEVYVVAQGPPSLARGGRGSTRLTSRPPFLFVVQPEPAAPPPAPPAAPDNPPPPVAPLPELKVTLLSPKVVAGEPATFAVSLINATPFEYAINMGDGKEETRTDRDFSYTYAESGPVTVIARFPAGAPIIESRLPITVEAAPAVAPPIALTIRAVPAEVTVDTPVTLEIATTDGRPLTEYTLDLGDGSQALTRSSASFVVSYQRPDTYVVSVAPVGGATGTAATTSITVSAAFPTLWLYGVLAFAGLVGAVAAGRAIRGRFLPPVATFYPRLDLTPRFNPSRANGVALEVRYVPHLASLRYAPRVLIGPEE